MSRVREATERGVLRGCVLAAALASAGGACAQIFGVDDWHGDTTGPGSGGASVASTGALATGGSGVGGVAGSGAAGGVSGSGASAETGSGAGGDTTASTATSASSGTAGAGGGCDPVACAMIAVGECLTGLCDNNQMCAVYPEPDGTLCNTGSCQGGVCACSSDADCAAANLVCDPGAIARCDGTCVCAECIAASDCPMMCGAVATLCQNYECHCAV